MLYFIGTEDRIKIGISANPGGRLAAIQTSNSDQCRLLLAIDILNDREVEALLHERLSFCRLTGEWFRVSFATALDHLFAVRRLMSVRGTPELHLHNTPKPSLDDCRDDCRDEFVRWFLAKYRPDGVWDQQLHPLSYCWDQLGDEFLSTHVTHNETNEA